MSGLSSKADIRKAGSDFRAQIKKPIDATQQMIAGNVILKAKVVKQSLWRRLRPHHHSALLENHKKNGTTPATDEQAQLNQQNLHLADIEFGARHFSFEG